MPLSLAADDCQSPVSDPLPFSVPENRSVNLLWPPLDDWLAGGKLTWHCTSLPWIVPLTSRPVCVALRLGAERRLHPEGAVQVGARLRGLQDPAELPG